MSQAKVILGLVLNVASSVGIIFVNKKLVFENAKFSFATILTVIHFIITFCGCLGFARANFFEIKKLDITKVFSICAAFCGYVVFNNLSLLTNSVSVYQIAKIMCTPVIVALEYFIFGVTQSKATLLALVPVCVGIFVTVYADGELNFIGSFWAILAIIANSFYTIWGKTKQKELGVVPMQLLTYQAPISALMLLPSVPVFDDWHSLITYNMSAKAILFILISCVFAFSVNFSFFLSVGQTSPLTMNVLGYLKTCFVFVGGFLFFDTQMTVQNITGISLTMIGLALYSRAKMAPEIKHEPEDPPSEIKVSAP